MVLMAGVELPSKAIREQVSSAVDLIVHIQRFPDGSRKITHLTEVGRLEGDVITTSDIYKLMNDNGAVTAGGTLRSTGIRPIFADRLREAGVGAG